MFGYVGERVDIADVVLYDEALLLVVTGPEVVADSYEAVVFATNVLLWLGVCELLYT